MQLAPGNLNAFHFFFSIVLNSLWENWLIENTTNGLYVTFSFTSKGKFTGKSFLHYPPYQSLTNRRLGPMLDFHTELSHIIFIILINSISFEINFTNCYYKGKYYIQSQKKLVILPEEKFSLL